ncbi:Non-hemolytic phospholipase C (modular protein) (plasmid) [Streptantibioticus cattleyicolor NRRL 8057 = DSM 46488]|nr:Non-hemolytic phospholipase C (modular protein) [Streptantibioticus cattleyicolor NRRL 8057 = DSM 46488]
MTEFSRRRLIRSALGVGAATTAATLLPPNLRRAMAEPPRRPGSLDDIEHVVVLMQENRSFDHYFGTLPGVRGFDDPDAARLPNGRPVFYQPDPGNPDGYLLPFHLDTTTSSAQAIPSTSHAWSVQHAAWNGGRMDNWLPAHRKADGDAHGPYTMGYYKRRDIPFHFALAESFTICDAYHCSVLGPTWPNRLYHWTGTIDPAGTHGGPVISNVIPEPFRWTTYPERLTKAGVSWHVYQQEDDYGCNPLEFFQAYQDARPGDPLYEHGLTIGPADQFARDALAGRLPTVSWIIPTAAQCEHPDYTPASGADFLARQLDAVAANPEVWRKTVFIVNYDENDGLFDHVIPPTPPRGTPDEFVQGLPIGAGIRVPCIIVSPWTQGGFVASEPFDHTSVLRFLERITGVRESNISDWRRRTFGDLTSALGFPRPRPFPSLPDTKQQLWAAEHETATLPPAPIPGAHQTPPHQGGDHHLKPLAGSTATASELRGARHYSTSRAEENATTHADDFPHGTAGTDFPGRQDAVPRKAPTTGEHAYAAGITSYSIAVIDTSTHRLVASVKAGSNPYGIARTPDGHKLYITNSGASNVSVFDTRRGTITGSVKVGLYPHGVAVSPGGHHVYVADTGPDTGAGGSRSVSVIDTRTDKTTATWQVGPAPHALAAAPDGRTLYVTCADGLAVVDTGHGAVRHRLTGQARARGVAVHPDGRHVYVVDTGQDTLSVIDTRRHRVTARVRVGRTPWQVAVAPDGSRVYVTGANDDTVTVIDAANHRVVARVTVDHVPTGITATAHTVWVSANASSTVLAIDARTLKVVGRAPLGISSQPSGVVVA